MILFGLSTVYVFLAAMIVTAEMETETIVALNEPAVAVIFADKQGQRDALQISGCCVDPSGLLLTTAHLVSDAANYRAVFPNGQEYRLVPKAVDLGRDLVLFKSDQPVGCSVRIGNADLLKKGAPLLALTAPASLAFTATTGIVSNLDRSFRDNPVIQTTIPLGPGSSGGPVFDRQGCLVGLVFGSIEELPNTTLVYPINTAFGLLQDHGVSVPGPRLADVEKVRLLASVPPVEKDAEAVELFNGGVKATSTEEKIGLYRAALERDPDFYEAWFNVAHAYTGAGRIDDAIAAYRQAERLRPGAVEVQRNLGRLFLVQGRLEETLACFQRAVEHTPGTPTSHNDLGEAYRRVGRFDEAVEEFGRALALNPNYAFARFNLAVTYLQQGDHARALRQFKEYLTRHPKSPDADQIRAWIIDLDQESN